MSRCSFLVAALALLVLGQRLRADTFDNYTNPVLAKAAASQDVKEITQITPEMIADNDRVVPGITGAVLIVQTNDGRFCKLLVQAARQKVDAATTVPILLIERYVTYREGQERAVQASGQNVCLFDDFRISLDIGQVVPPALGGDLHFVVRGDKSFAEPLAKAKLYLVTKALAEAAPKKQNKLVFREPFEPHYFNASYKLYDDGRRSGTLKLEVAKEGEVTGSYYSDKDGQKYDVEGKIGATKHSIQFTIKFPRSRQSFQGWMFTGNGKALTGYSKIQEREAGFYALRTEEE
jgi:hypothetical protein